MGWLRSVGSLKWQVSFAKEPYKRDDVLQKRPIILRSLLIAATPCEGVVSHESVMSHIRSSHIWYCSRVRSVVTLCGILGELTFENFYRQSVRHAREIWDVSTSTVTFHFASSLRTTGTNQTPPLCVCVDVCTCTCVCQIGIDRNLRHSAPTQTFYYNSFNSALSSKTFFWFGSIC